MTERISPQTMPLANYLKLQSSFTCNYNPSFAEIRNENGDIISEGLYIRSQNIIDPPYGVGESVITLVQSKSDNKKFDDLNKIELEKITKASIVLKPDTKSKDNYGVEDPRVFYRKKNE